MVAIWLILVNGQLVSDITHLVTDWFMNNWGGWEKMLAIIGRDPANSMNSSRMNPEPTLTLDYVGGTCPLEWGDRTSDILCGTSHSKQRIEQISIGTK